MRKRRGSPPCAKGARRPAGCVAGPSRRLASAWPSSRSVPQTAVSRRDEHMSSFIAIKHDALVRTRDSVRPTRPVGTTVGVWRARTRKHGDILAFLRTSPSPAPSDVTAEFPKKTSRSMEPTRSLEGLAPARAWGFESPLPHQPSLTLGLPLTSSELRLGKPTDRRRLSRRSKARRTIHPQPCEGGPPSPPSGEDGPPAHPQRGRPQRPHVHHRDELALVAASTSASSC